MYNGEQLNNTNSEIVYVDFSPISRKVAQERTRVRRLHNIIWVEGWIEGILILGLGVLIKCKALAYYII